jgi:hypothetical protein
VNPVSIAKLALALAGIAVFLLGINTGNVMVRWTGIGLVVVAWLLRFVARPSVRQDRDEADPTRTGPPPEA